MDKLRKKLEILDKKIILLLNKRMDISLQLGKLKFKNKIKIKQAWYWKSASAKRFSIASKTKVNKAFVKNIFEEIQKESIEVQKKVFSDLKNGKK